MGSLSRCMSDRPGCFGVLRMGAPNRAAPDTRSQSTHSAFIMAEWSAFGFGEASTCWTSCDEPWHAVLLRSAHPAATWSTEGNMTRKESHAITTWTEVHVEISWQAGDARRDAEGTIGDPIVVTPGSGAGLALLTARRLTTLLRRRGRESNLRTFGNLAALRRWAETCKPDFTHLICVGGDATISAAAHAAIRLDLPFVAVPQGFGNVFAHTFHYPDRPEAVVSLLEHGHVRRVDVGLARNGPATEMFLFAPQLRLARLDPTRRRARASAAAQSHAAVLVVLRCCVPIPVPEAADCLRRRSGRQPGRRRRHPGNRRQCRDLSGLPAAHALGVAHRWAI